MRISSLRINAVALDIAIGITKSAQGLGVIEFPGFGYVSKDKCYFSNWVNFREFAKGYKILLFDWIKSKISHWNLINISFFLIFILQLHVIVMLETLYALLRRKFLK